MFVRYKINVCLDNSSEIINECLAFYFIELLWDFSAFNKENSKVIRNNVTHWRTVPLNQFITSKMCNVFSIQEETKKNTDHSTQSFFIGFVKGSVENLNRKVSICNTQSGNFKITESIKILRDKATLMSDFDKKLNYHEILVWEIL